ncbi:hypothetical protein G4G28_12680 [Massilia sp. Dwa41.01b]|uniref:hypothetical protein n=1 Tax=unclassified Massilia TaxID=2609279 RepID=UPI0015FEC9DE|nr:MULTISPECIES: hypothetical protein [unclassified Massilia]QNA89116.1 hypothetical protein G4G28_12680 [Massilia sp. Dwa41.01b]QNB00006.1 hypothetical protein G4G31_16255 [Massilia sp. Se16.2.3]
MLSLVIAGCASTRPEDFAVSDRHEEIALQEKISTVSYRGLNVRCEEGALPGVYVAAREDAEGVYYFGKDRTIWMTNAMVQPKPRLQMGGIYVPKNGAKPPRFFYIFEQEAHVVDSLDKVVQQRADQVALAPGAGPNIVGTVIGGALVAGIIANNVGKIEMYPPIDDAELGRKIRAAIRPATAAR